MSMQGYLLCCIAEKHTKKQLTPFMEFHRFVSSDIPQFPSDNDIKELEREYNLKINGSTNYVDFVWVVDEPITNLDMSINEEYELEKPGGFDHMST